MKVLSIFLIAEKYVERLLALLQSIDGKLEFLFGPWA